MEIKLRKESKNDFESVFKLIEKAFQKEEHSDHKEQFLVERLRKSPAFIPELAIVAEVDNKIVGHILFTKLEIKNQSQSFESLALAPVSVLPEFHGKGIGSKLILYGHEIAKNLGYNSVILLGIVAITSILFIQLFWIKKTIQAQALAITIQEKEDSLNAVRFSERAHIALRDVLEQLAQQTPIPTNSANLYGAVKQLSVNYFL